MSCEFHLTATLEGLNKFLDQDKSDHDDHETEGSRKTLSNFKISVSSTGEIIAFAKKTWLLICGSKWNSEVADSGKIKYSPNWHGHVNCKQGEEIMSVLCLPFLSQGQSSQGCADWTCIVVGFSSGCIRFYTEAMQELACSILHEEPITDIKSHSLNTVQQGKTQKQETNDVHILYKTVICVLNGSLLSQTLRNRRYQLAKGISFSSSEINGYTLLDFKKYSFDGQEEVTDASFLGPAVGSSLNVFDHLVTASLVGGFHSNYRISPPQTSLIVTSGRRPFVGFHYTLEGGNSPVLTDVALAVASKIKNSVAATLPDWFGFGNKKPSQPDKPKEVAQDYAEKLSCRFGLCDLWRQGQSVIVSPNGAFSAVSDSLGRVLLIDNATGIAHQMWKGYRDAQCGFMPVQEDIRKLKKSKDGNPKPQPRQGLFIVIYAPKKGLIEIFTTQNGRLVTSFKVTKYGRLLYIPRHPGPNVSASGLNFSQNQVVFISEEGLKDFMIPFHCALAEDNSKLSRDLHVLKKLKMLLKMENHSSNPKSVEEIEKCAKELKMDEVRLQAIESMVTYKNTTLEAFKVVLKVFLDDLNSKDRKDPPPRKIVTFAESILNLLLFYEFLLGLNETLNLETETAAAPDFMSEELRLPQKELDIIMKFVGQIKSIEDIKKQTTKVAFEEKKSTKLGQYLSCFDFENFLNRLYRNEKAQDKKESSACWLNLKSSNKEHKFGYLGEILYKGVFSSRSSINQWKRHAHSCCLNPTDLALCLLSYWCNEDVPDDFYPEVCSLVEILKVICDMNEPNVVAVEYNAESPWWSCLRSYIGKNSHTIRCLFAALSCRSVTVFVEQEKEFKCSSDKKHSTKSNEETAVFNNEWETMSKDTCQWDILITQLQDVALLNAILNLSFKTQNKSKILPQVPYDFEYQCLTSIQASGTGRVSELVAKWMVQFGFDPVTLINKNDLEFQADGKREEIEKCCLIEKFDKANEARNTDQNLNLALDYLALLKSRFPFSLTSSSLLGNMCWEYIAYWYKNISDVDYLEAAVRFLEVVPNPQIKYGISYLSWNTYLQPKFETLAKMINRAGKVPRDKLCFQEIGLRSHHVSVFLSFLREYLQIMLRTDLELESPVANEEAIWQNSSAASSSSLVIIIMSQPLVDSDLVMFQLQLSNSLLAMSGLNIKHSRVLCSLFDYVEGSNFTLTSNSQPSSYQYNLKLKKSRTEFLQKVLTAAVQTVELVEYIPPISADEDFSLSDSSTQLKVDEYKKWLQLCFELAGMWAISLDNLRRHQICELYSNGFDRLAEEVIPSVNETVELASQLLVLGGKRFKYILQDWQDFTKKFSNLSAHLNDWIQTLDLSNFKYQCGTADDIEVIMCYVLKWLPEGHPDQKLAIGIIESLSSITAKDS